MKDLMRIENEDGRMSSREIAELTGKQHFHVMRDIKKMVEGLGIHESKYGSVNYIDKKGKERPEYRLDYEMTMTLVTGYSVKLRNAVIKRWQELERKSAPRTYIEALQSLIEAEKTKEQLQIRLDENMEWYTVKRVKALGFLADIGERAAWPPLRRYSLDNGYDMPVVPDVNYTTVKSYHKDVWEAVYGIDLQ
jgi:phage regulator Rha-like protein